MRCSVGAHSHRKPGRRFEDDTYNYSAVVAEIPARAGQEAASIFERIGVAIACMHCPPTSSEAVGNRAFALPEATVGRPLTESEAEAKKSPGTGVRYMAFIACRR
jgi:hypothetical protein